MSTFARIETHVFNVCYKTNWVFIAVTAADGRTGWGEASLIGWEPMLVAAVAPASDTLEIQFDYNPLCEEVQAVPGFETLLNR